MLGDNCCENSHHLWHMVHKSYLGRRWWEKKCIFWSKFWFLDTKLNASRVGGRFGMTGTVSLDSAVENRHSFLIKSFQSWCGRRAPRSGRNFSNEIGYCFTFFWVLWKFMWRTNVRLLYNVELSENLFPISDDVFNVSIFPCTRDIIGYGERYRASSRLEVPCT